MTWISTTRFLHTENASTFFLPYLRRSRAVLPTGEGKLRDLKNRGRGMRGLGLLEKNAGIHGLAGARYGLEIKFASRDLNEHEGLIGIEALQHVSGRAQVVNAQLAGITQNKVVDPALRL